MRNTHYTCTRKRKFSTKIYEGFKIHNLIVHSYFVFYHVTYIVDIGVTHFNT